MDRSSGEVKARLTIEVNGHRGKKEIMLYSHQKKREARQVPSLSTKRAIRVPVLTVIRRSYAIFTLLSVPPHCTVSPWSARSRPSSSMSLDTRSPMKISTTFRIISVTTQS